MVIEDAQRISVLRQRCLARKIQGWLDTSPLSAGSLRASEHAPSVLVRRGLLTRDRLRGLRFAIDEYELLAGRVQPPTYAESELAQAHEYLSRQPSIGGQTGHCELDLSELFAGGIAGIRARITSLKGQATEEQADTYESFLLALDGMEAMANNAAQAADAAIATAEPWRKAELEQISAACRHISLNPPQTFREAIQLLWLADLGVMFGDQVGLVVPGHLDRTLWPFYQADLAAGRVTREQALALIESLYILINEFIPDGLAMSVMVGGRDAGGRDVTNDLSYLCLEAIRRTKLIYPTVGICWHDGTPQALADLAVELISKGFPTPAFFNDATIQKGLRALGLPPQEACNYINSTCVEITPVGASNVWVASPYFNLCVYLLDEIAAQCGMGVPPMRSTGVSPVSDNQQQDAGKMPAAHEGETPSTHAGKMPATQFEDFLQAYYRRLAREIAAAVAVQDNCRRAERGVHGGTPLQSVFTRDCIARGQDINRGGATYNWVECSFVGMANLADSLEVIRDEVFERRTLTLAELRAALDADFAGMEPLRMRLLNGHPKYGNGAAEVDSLVARTAAFCQASCATHRIWPGDSPFVPGAFCWIMHEALGRETGATPDGRKAHFPFADGGGPAQGRERLGPTAAILSTTSWDHSPMIGGLAYNMKFNSSLFDSEASVRHLRDLVVTYLRRGGFETQVNVVDRATLLAAREHPEQYRDLAVRIGGYVDYFTRLSPQMQEEVLLRTEFTQL